MAKCVADWAIYSARTFGNQGDRVLFLIFSNILIKNPLYLDHCGGFHQAGLETSLLSVREEPKPRLLQTTKRLVFELALAKSVN